MAIFIERDCECGGCGCAAWSDWWTALREAARSHPRHAELDSIADHDAYCEALDALADELSNQLPQDVDTAGGLHPDRCKWKAAASALASGKEAIDG